MIDWGFYVFYMVLIAWFCFQTFRIVFKLSEWGQPIIQLSKQRNAKIFYLFLIGVWLLLIYVKFHPRRHEEFSVLCIWEMLFLTCVYGHLAVKSQPLRITALGIFANGYFITWDRVRDYQYYADHKLLRFCLKDKKRLFEPDPIFVGYHGGELELDGILQNYLGKAQPETDLSRIPFPAGRASDLDANNNVVDERVGIACLECGQLIHGDDKRCPDCGWTWIHDNIELSEQQQNLR